MAKFIYKFLDYLSGEEKNFGHPVWIFAVLAAGVLYPFLCGIGGMPEMDESSYIYVSTAYNYALHTGQTLPPLLGMSFWPLLLSFIPELPGSSFVWYRLADMLCALLFGFLFCRCLQRLGGHMLLSLILALLILICMTAQETMNNGFKNSYFPAWCCLWGALLITQKYASRVLPLLAAGGLASLAVLLRETLFPFALLGFFAIWKGWNFRAAFFFALGGIALACIALGSMELVHQGNLASFYKGYADRSLFYKNEAGRTAGHILVYGFRSLKLYSPALIFIAACMGLSALCKRSKAAFSPWELSCWLLAFLLPLYEPLFKYSFYYHYAMCLPGLGGLCALLSRKLSPAAIQAAEKKYKKSLNFFAILCLGGLLASFTLLPSPERLINSMRFLAEGGKWSREDPLRNSTSFEAAAKIKKLLPPHGSLSVNGYAFMLYPLSGVRPPWDGEFDPDDNFHLGDLGRFLTNINLDAARLMEAIKNNPPDVIAVAVFHSTHEQSYSREIAAALEKSGLYELAAKVEPDSPGKKKRHYGWLGYDIYRLKNAAARERQASGGI